LTERSWQETYGRGRERVFVGRERELEAGKSFLESDQERVLYIHGVGGVGKTTLLRKLQAHAEQTGWTTRWLDATVLSDSVPRIEEAFLEQTESEGPVLLCLDSFEAIAHLDEWLRSSLLPKLPTSVWLAIAGRGQLSSSWRTSPAWSQLTRLVRLEPFDEDESRAYLNARDVDVELHDHIIEISQGLPIVLTLSAEHAAKSSTSDAFVPPADLEDVFTRLSQSKLTDGQLGALRVSALVWATTEGLLDAALDLVDAAEMMRWLAQRPYIQCIDDGLQPHPVVRRLVDDQFHQTAPARRESQLERIQAHYLAQARRHPGRTGVNSAFDVMYLLRREPGGKMFKVGQAEPVYRDHPRPGDNIIGLIESFEGPTSAEIAQYWMDKHPELSIALRGSDGELRGFVQSIVLEQCKPEERAFDPAVDLTLCELDELDDLRPGETARMCRFWFDAQAYQARSALQVRLFAVIWSELAMTPGASNAPTIHRDPEIWDKAKDRHLEKLGEVSIDDHAFAIYNRDWRRFDAIEQLEKSIAVARTNTAPAEPIEPRFDVFTRDEVDAAVRDALRDFRCADRLRNNPLVRSRSVRLSPQERSDPDRTISRLREVIEDAVESLGAAGGDREHRTLLRETFIDSSDNQRAVADRLSMSLSTYRRMLSTAIDRVVARLWHIERRG
jgi:hypothetical protein